jgi:hypothetical protein
MLVFSVFGPVVPFDVTRDCRRLFPVFLGICGARLVPIFLGYGTPSILFLWVLGAYKYLC